MLGIDPERILFQNNHLFNINDINHALSFIFFGLLSICIGFYIGENIFPSRRIRPLELINFYKKYPPVNLLTSMLLILLINLYINYGFYLLLFK